MSIFSSIVNYAYSNSNYNLVNVNNMFNHMIATLEMLTDEQQVKYIQNIKINLGMSIYNQFKDYLFKKLPNSEFIKKGLFS